MAVSLQKIGNALDQLGGGSIDLLINTHWHFDHTDGNEWVHAAGAAIIAHENTRKHMSTETRVDDWNFTFPPSPAGALPTRLVSKADALDFNGTRILIEYYGPAHTDGDLSVTFEEFDVVNVGDTWWNGSYPFIDYSTGGSIGGTIEATERNIAKGSDDTVFIPGHGPPGDLDLLASRRGLSEEHASGARRPRVGRRCCIERPNGRGCAARLGNWVVCSVSTSQPCGTRRRDWVVVWSRTTLFPNRHGQQRRLGRSMQPRRPTRGRCDAQPDRAARRPRTDVGIPRRAG